MADIINLVAKNGSPTINGNEVTITRENVVGTSKYVTEGLWYWEVTINSPLNHYGYIGVGVGTSSMTTYASSSSFYLWNNNSQLTNMIYNNSTTVETISKIKPLNIEDTIGIVLDATNKTIQFFFKDRYTTKYQMENMSDFSPIFLLKNTTVTTVCTVNFGERDFLLLPNIEEWVSNEYNSNINTLSSYNGAISKLIAKKRILLKSNNIIYSHKSGKTIKMNDLDKHSSLITDGNIVTSTSNAYTGIRSDTSIEKGKYYLEVVVRTNVRLDASHLGVIEKSRALDYGTSLVTFTGARTYRGNGTKYTPSSSSYGEAWAKDDVISMLIDMDLGKLSFWRNGVDLGVASSDLKSMENVYLLVMPYGNQDSLEVVFDKRFFKYNIPTGYNDSIDSMLNKLPSDSIENFINYGEPSIDYFNLINTNKNYIAQDGISENTDGLWVQDINRKPLSIKFEQGGIR